MEVSLMSLEEYVNRLGLRYDGKTQLKVTLTAREYMRPYVPMLSGDLRNSAEIVDGGTAILYNTPYAHYQYKGVKYVDPVYRVGAFYSEDYGFWSRRGVNKVPTDIPLNYSNPNATPYWDRTMVERDGLRFEEDVQNWFDREYSK